MILLCQYVFGKITLNLFNVVKMHRGVRVVKAQLSDSNGFPVYQNSLMPLGYFEKNNCEGNTTFVIAAGAAGEIGYSKEKFWAADDCYYFECMDNLNPRYLYYYLLTKRQYLMTQVRKASIPRISKTAFEKMSIELPPIEEQNRIVSILDRFDALCNDITKGIPAEIEARQKQYEYYRNKLLTFESR